MVKRRIAARQFTTYSTRGVPVKRVFFVHLAKTAGVSIESLLRPEYPSERICPSYHLAELLDLDRPPTDYDLYLGHLPYCALDLVGPVDFVFTILRDPVARGISALEHLRRDTSHPQHQLLMSETSTLREVLAHPRLRGQVSNPQTRYLGLDAGIRAAYEAHKAGGLPRMRAAKAVYEALRQEATDDVYEQARKNIAEMNFVGITEQLDDAVRALSGLLGLTCANAPRLNVAPSSNKHERYGLEEEELLREANAYDLALHEFARNEFATRFGTV